MFRAFYLLTGLACGVLALQAQPWEALRGLVAGDKIKVLDNSHARFNGPFVAFSDHSISIQAHHGIVEVERARVHQVQVRSESRRVRNILIGAGIGVAVGVVLDQTGGTYVRNEIGESSGARALTYAVPIALFTGIGAVLPAYRTIYRAP